MKRTFLPWFPVFAWMGVIFYLSSQTGLGGPPWKAIVGHVGEYSILAGLGWAALRSTTALSNGRILILAIALSTLYGISDEWHQSFVPGRTPDPFDVLVDFAAATGAASLLTALKPIR